MTIFNQAEKQTYVVKLRSRVCTATERKQVQTGCGPDHVLNWL